MEATPSMSQGATKDRDNIDVRLEVVGCTCATKGKNTKSAPHHGRFLEALATFLVDGGGGLFRQYQPYPFGAVIFVDFVMKCEIDFETKKSTPPYQKYERTTRN